MTLFTLLLVMALERVSTKSKQFHISTFTQQFFLFLEKRTWLSSNSSLLTCCLLAFVPAFGAWLAVVYLPGLLVFAFYLFCLWVCLGSPDTRQTYKRYLQAAQRNDFEACSLYSESLGNKGGQLSEVGKQLVLVNYRQYASIIIYFVLLGIPGVVFYSVVKELYFHQRDNAELLHNSTDALDSAKKAENGAKRLLFILDIIPVRITSFGFLLVGHFSNGLSAWLSSATQLHLNAYDVLANVAKASEEPVPCDNPYLNEPLQMVKLVKRNIVFLLMAISLMTLVGVVA